MDILLNSTNALVWTSNKVTSYALKANIPSSVLTNGNEYKIQITIWNQANASITSDAQVFQTSSRPVVTVNTIGTVNSFNFNFTATYYQAESVPLRNYSVNLYDSKKNIIQDSGIKTTSPLEHLFSNLQTEQQYYIEFIATSTKGMTGTSGLILFDCFYYRPKMNVNLQGKNIDNAGIELSWFVVQIIGKTDGSQFIGDEKIDTTDNTEVWFDEGFDISQDFSLKLWLENVPSKHDLIILNGANGQIKLQYHWLDQCFHLYKIINNSLTTEWVSESVEGTNFVVLVQQINKDMNIFAEVIV